MNDSREAGRREIPVNLQMAERYSDIHKQEVGKWAHGRPDQFWTDKDGYFCIRYEDGSWWHYKETDGILEWW